MAADALRDLAAAQARRPPAEPAASEARAHVRALRERHGGGVAAVLMYGSSLRDGQVADRILDFYVLVDRTGRAYRSVLPRLLAALDQPNVHYLPPGGDRAAPAKYALMSLRRFARRAGPAAFTSYIWGRFAQPSWLVWARDAAAERAVLDALAEAAQTMIASAAPLEPPEVGSEAVWIRAFTESYRSEPRAEPAGKAAELYRAHADHYDALFAAADAALDSEAADAALDSEAAARARWARRRVWGKALAVARIAKSALTFEGGLDYAIWKIGRHSRTPTDTAGMSTGGKIGVLWRLIRTRAIR